MSISKPVKEILFKEFYFMCFSRKSIEKSRLDKADIEVAVFTTDLSSQFHVRGSLRKDLNSPVSLI